MCWQTLVSFRELTEVARKAGGMSGKAGTFRCAHQGWNQASDTSQLEGFRLVSFSFLSLSIVSGMWFITHSS